MFLVLYKGLLKPPRPMTRLGNRERHLLLSIELLDDASRPIKSDAIVGEVQQALAKQQEREKQQREKEHVKEAEHENETSAAQKQRLKQEIATSVQS